MWINASLACVQSLRLSMSHSHVFIHCVYQSVIHMYSVSSFNIDDALTVSLVQHRSAFINASLTCILSCAYRWVTRMHSVSTFYMDLITTNLVCVYFMLATHFFTVVFLYAVADTVK